MFSVVGCCDICSVQSCSYLMLAVAGCSQLLLVEMGKLLQVASCFTLSCCLFSFFLALMVVRYPWWTILGGPWYRILGYRTEEGRSLTWCRIKLYTVIEYRHQNLQVPLSFSMPVFLNINMNTNTTRTRTWTNANIKTSTINNMKFNMNTNMNWFRISVWAI
jgi:hypothetical protein